MGLRRVEMFADGACKGNGSDHARGGWGTLLRCQARTGPHERALSGALRGTTNNRMELTAVIEGLRALRQPCEVTITTDSRYVVQGFTEWLPGWISRGWRKADRKPAPNRDLWEALTEAARPHAVTFHWIKGHAGHPENERCDQLATEAALTL